MAMDTIYRTTILPMDTIPLISHHHLAIYGYYLSSNYLWLWVPFEKTWVQQFYWYLVNVKTLDIKGNWNWKNTDIKSPTEGTTLSLLQWDQLQWGPLRLGKIFLANCELKHMQKRCRRRLSWHHSAGHVLPDTPVMVYLVCTGARAGVWVVHSDPSLGCRRFGPRLHLFWMTRWRNG